LATLFGELQKEKKQKSHQKLSETLKNLLYCVYGCPSYIAKDLVKIFQEVNSEVRVISVDHMSYTLLLKIIVATSYEEDSCVLSAENVESTHCEFLSILKFSVLFLNCVISSSA
jgi:hypothetical protein